MKHGTKVVFGFIIMIVLGLGVFYYLDKANATNQTDVRASKLG